jgi:aspartyl-tRNA(Asn)/glutamyl-tRNA(Gln) amidotransferase subunit B
MSVATGPRPRASALLERYEAVIGIEVHCQPKTASKLFCRCRADYDGAPPNSLVCPVCLGLPGVLPVLNRRAVEHVLRVGLAVEATIPSVTRWDRKNYFYPDLPKGYQISQYQIPLAANGRLVVETAEGPLTVRIRRAHLEEDTAKLVHAELDGRPVSLVDFNRSGAPLMEIVTEPDIRTAEGARRYAEELQLLLRTIGASDADMERGQLRVEANVSVRPRGAAELGTRIEIKNMNSFRSVERAIAYEIERQAAALEAGEPLRQETRGWDENRGATYVMRVKESEDDYRYFPEPDLPPLRIEPAWLEAIRAELPELPAARRARYREALGLPAADAAVVVADLEATALFEGLLAAGVAPKAAANWVTGEYLRHRKAGVPVAERLAPERLAPELARLIGLVEAGRLTLANAKGILAEHLERGEPVERLAAGYERIDDAAAIERIVDEVLAANPAAVADVRAGKDQAIRFLVGQVMKATRGQANAARAEAVIRSRLGPAGGAGAGSGGAAGADGATGGGSGRPEAKG